jgi:ABC-2 type transport system permease protein
VRYSSFLVPGLVMMSVLQNSFANSSSSLIQSKITGNIVFRAAGADLLSGILLGLRRRPRWRAGWRSAPACSPSPPGSSSCAWRRRCGPRPFALLGAALAGALGLLAGIVSEKIDQLAAFQNFVILPLTMLSGVFYSIHSLPPVLARAFARQPVLLHDRRLPLRLLRRRRHRAGREPLLVGAAFAAVAAACLLLLKSGYKLRT